MATVTVTDRNAGNAVVPRADNIVTTVADHERVRRRDVLLVQHMGDQVALVGPRAVHLAAVDGLEIRRQTEVFGNRTGIEPRLRRHHEQSPAITPKQVEQFRHALVDTIFVHADIGKTLTVISDGLAGTGLIQTVEVHERFLERRADKALKIGQIEHPNILARERELHATRNALARVGQRTVEIE